MLPCISESIDFWWTIPQKKTNTATGHFDAIDDWTIGISKVFEENKAVEAVEANEVAEAAEVPMAQKITTEDFRVILDLELEDKNNFI